MPLAAGARLGPYEIIGALGAGGMGEVYRAHDAKLGRDVAIKILPDSFAGDPERVARFEREARALASLNHPNIAQIFEAGSSYLAMELVEGEDLSATIARGPLPVSDALAIARQIADALEAAHDAGVIHRDLKPANIKVRPEGTVKVLDFGLAKATGVASASGSGAATITSPAATGLGVILGTASYMSPEQARGRAVDKRADLWAFGCVLFEMLTGRTMFAGDTVTDVIAAVVTREPDWQTLPKATPTAIRRLLARCLEKDPRRRLRDAGDARLEIDAAAAETDPAQHGVGAAGNTSGSRPTWRWPAIAALAFVVGAAIAWTLASNVSRTRSESPGIRWLAVSRPSPASPIKISPDGQWLVAEESPLKVRRIGESDWRKLPGTEGLHLGEVFWSADSRHIGFQMGDSLKKVHVQGSAPESICDKCLTPEALRGATWNRAGVILVSAGRPRGAQVGLSGIWQIAETGGPIRDVTTPDVARGDNSHRYPFFLPDGRRFLFTARRSSGEHAFMLGSLDEGAPVQVALGYSTVAYASGFLLFVRNGSLIATPFDGVRGQTTGDGITVADRVEYHPGVGYAMFSVSQEGTLIINQDGGRRGIGFVDRFGRPSGLVTAGIIDESPRVSRDGTHIVAGIIDPKPGSADVFTIDIATGARTQLTSDPRWDQTPVWSPDGKSVMYRAPVNAKHWLFTHGVGASASEPERRLLSADDGGDLIVNDWTPDGDWALIEKRVTGGSTDLVLLPMPGADRFEPWLTTSFNEFEARLSFDGRWVAYVSDESGANEVYVRAFKGAGAGRRVTTTGGRHPVWGRDGKELFFRDGTGVLASTPVTVGATLTTGATQPLFGDAVQIYGDRGFDVDGRGRFLMNYVEQGAGGSRSEILLNWAQAVRK